MRDTLSPDPPPRPQFLAECLERADELVRRPTILAAEVAADVAELARLLTAETDLTRKLDHGVSLITQALGFTPGSADFEVLVSSISDLVARRDVHPRLIATLSQSTPLPDEAANWPAQRAALLAEVGTLRAEVAELRRTDDPPAACTGRYVPGMPCRPHAGCRLSGCPAAAADSAVFATARLRDAHPTARHALSPLLGYRFSSALVHCTHADLADPKFREWLAVLKMKIPPTVDLRLEVSW